MLKMKSLLGLLLLAVCLQFAVGANHVTEYEHKTCERKFNKIGCYDEYNAHKGKLLVSYRDSVQWNSIATFLHSLACKCVEEVKKENEKISDPSKKYVGFALHYYGECFGRTKAHLDELIGRTKKSHRCVGDQTYVRCEDDHNECVGKNFAEYVYELKQSAPKDIDGGYSDWESWTPCTPNCGWGVKIRERTCTKPEPKGKGKDCETLKLGPSTETKRCKAKECPVDGGFTGWSKYGECDKSCGGGTQTKSRSCTDPAPAHGGSQCKGPTTETRSCNTHKCPIDGKWTDWSAYSTCTAACGGGKKTRTRGCTNPKPEHGGAECKGEYMEEEDCNTHHCPVHGGYDTWKPWSTCTKSCGTGTQTRSRTCTKPSPAHGGNDCKKLGSSSETKNCNTNPCPVPISREYTARTCEHSNLPISCHGSASIMITYASYGRKTKRHCGKWYDWFWSTSCHASSSWSKVTQYCEGKRSCSVPAKNWLFGDPCWGTYKYLEVRYRCKG